MQFLKYLLICAPLRRAALLVLALWLAPDLAWAQEGDGAGGAEGADNHGSGDDDDDDDDDDEDERLPYHLDSWSALAIVGSAVFITFALNHAAPAVRTAGTALAALSCFLVAGWFGFVVASGIWSAPAPPELPVDVFKPPVLALQGLAALITGCILVWVAQRQSLRADRLMLPMENAPTRYGHVARWLHWVIAILILALVPMGIFMTMIPEGIWYREGYYVAHKSLGLLVLMLAVVRLAWRGLVPYPPLAMHLQPWERGLAHSMHALLYVLMFAFPLSGFVMSTSSGNSSHFFFWDTPILWAENEQWTDVSGLMHKVILPYIFYLVIGAHVLGALKHQFWDKQAGSFRRMVS